MRTETTDGKTVIYLDGRISSVNAEQVQEELADAIAAAPSTEIMFEAKDLEYISSAGLRVLLTVAQEQQDHMSIRNVSPEIYEIFEMTGLTEILDVTQKSEE